MFLVILIISLNQAIASSTFYLNARKTEFYQMNVQVNGNDLSDRLSDANLIIDEYVLDGSNILSVCYTYNPSKGIPNVKQLSKVELYNNKLSSKVRGLAHMTPNKVIPEYVSVSPQPQAFSTQEQVCMSYNFQDYRPEQLQALEERFNPKQVENIVEVVQPKEVLPDVVTQPVESSNVIHQSSEVVEYVEPELPLKDAVNEVAELPLQEVANETPQADNVYITEELPTIDQLTSENPPIASSPPSQTPPIDHSGGEEQISAQDALNFIPEDDFLNGSTELTPTENSVASQSDDLEQSGEAIEMPGELTLPNEGEMVAHDFDTSEQRQPASGEQETQLSDEEFFENLELE